MYDYPEIIRSSRIPYINKSDPNKITLEECIEAIEFRFAPQIHNDKLLANTLNQVKNKNTKIVEEVSLRLYSLIHKGCSHPRGYRPGGSCSILPHTDDLTQAYLYMLNLTETYLKMRDISPGFDLLLYVTKGRQP